MIESVHVTYFIIILIAGLYCFSIQSIQGRWERLAFTIPIVALVSLAISLRDIRLGADTRIYLQMYSNPDYFEPFIETAYIMALRLLRLISNDNIVYLFVSAFATNLIVYLAFVRFNPGLAAIAFALYCASPVFWTVNILILRNGLAAALIMYATIILVTAGRTRGFFAFVLAGAGFHYSALGHAVFLSVSNLSTLKHAAISAIKLILAALALIYVFPFFSTSMEPWIERFEDYQNYASSGRFAYENSGFKLQYAIPVLILTGAWLLRKRLSDKEILLFRYYLALLTLSILFWGNVLFRDRIYLPAQMMEPFLIALLMRRAMRDDSLFVLSGAASFLTMAVVTILFWSPRNVLQFY
ncbi:MAG: EpsG family protein [Cohaesibacter sp.]|nr:EpsG family protein [Cohaesibacter sp.]